MFYAHFVLAKKGPLARIWLAAHWDKKLTKAHVFETNIESSVEGILQPKVKMALRTSGHLLLGIVRIYSRKAKYLLADCNEAFIKIKMAFRPGVVDLPEGNREAAVATITLPEVFHDFDTAIPDITIDIDAQVTLNQSRAEDITLKEEYGTLSLMTEDTFGDMGFDDPEVARDATNIDDGFDHDSLLLYDDRSKQKIIEDPNTLQSASSSSINKESITVDANLKDAFECAAEVTDVLLDGEAGGLFEPAGLFDDAPLGNVSLEKNIADEENNEALQAIPEKQVDRDDSDDDIYDMGPGSVGAPSPPSSLESPIREPAENADKLSDLNINLICAEDDILCHTERDKTNDHVDSLIPSISNECLPTDGILDLTPSAELAPPPPQLPPLSLSERTILLNNEEESFALAPLDTTIVQGAEKTVKTKRKRKLIVDDVKNISGEEMKCQLSDTTDIVTTLDLAPPTKRLMHWKETGGVEKLFALPGHPILSKTLSNMYQRHLTTRSVENEELGVDGKDEDKIDLDACADLEQVREEDVIARKRRREMDPMLPQDLSQFDTMQLDTTNQRPSYPADLMPQALDVSSNFLQQHSLFPALPEAHSPMMNNIMPPPAHMIHQILPPEANQMSHIPSMLHSPTIGIDQTQQLHSVASSIHEMPMSVIPEPFSQPPHATVMESVAQHLLPTSISLTEIPQQHSVPPPTPNQFPPSVRPPTPNQFPPSVPPPTSNQFPPSVPPPTPNQFPPSVPPPNQFPPSVPPPTPNQFPPSVPPPTPNQFPPSVPPPTPNQFPPSIPPPTPNQFPPSVPPPTPNQFPPSVPPPTLNHFPSSVPPHSIEQSPVTSVQQLSIEQCIPSQLTSSVASPSSVPLPSTLSISETIQQPSIQLEQDVTHQPIITQTEQDVIQQQIVQECESVQQLPTLNPTCVSESPPICTLLETTAYSPVASNKQFIENSVQLPDINEENLMHTDACTDERLLECNELTNAQEPLTSENMFNTCSNQISLDTHIESTQTISEQVQVPCHMSNSLPESISKVPQDDHAVRTELDENILEKEARAHRSDDDDDDYSAPSSVGPVCTEEQMADETYEQFEERILTKRTTHMLHIIHNQLTRDKEVKFSCLVRGNKRKQVAQKFYTFLVLKKQQAVELQQKEPYGEMIITRGPKFNAVYNA